MRRSDGQRGVTLQRSHRHLAPQPRPKSRHIAPQPRSKRRRFATQPRPKRRRFARERLLSLVGIESLSLRSGMRARPPRPSTTTRRRPPSPPRSVRSPRSRAASPSRYAPKAESASHSKRSASLISQHSELGFGSVMEPSPLCIASEGGRPTRRNRAHSSLGTARVVWRLAAECRNHA